MIRKGMRWLPKKHWGFGILIERADSFDDYFSVEIQFFKIRAWIYKSFITDKQLLEKEMHD